MKAKLLTGINAVIAALLGMLGITGCENKGDDNLCMYGVPTATLDLSGAVTDEEHQSLENIRVAVHVDGSQPFRDTLYTTEDGMFTREYDFFPGIEYVDIIVEDTTGVYEKDSVRVTNLKFEGGDGNWNQGTATVQHDFELKKKSEND